MNHVLNEFWVGVTFGENIGTEDMLVLLMGKRKKSIETAKSQSKIHKDPKSRRPSRLIMCDRRRSCKGRMRKQDS